MLKNNKIKLSVIILITAVSIFFLINSIIGSDKFNYLKLFLDYEQRQLIKKYIFPYKLISQQQKTILMQKEFLKDINFFELELNYKKSNKDIPIIKSSFELSNNKTLNKYKLNSGFYAGIYEYERAGMRYISPGTGYIDFFDNNLFVLSSRGVLAFTKNLTDDEKNFKQIKNNINNFIGIKQFNKSHEFSLRDLTIFNKKIYISFIEEIKPDCWNTSIISGDINYENIQFKKLFSPLECIHSINNIDKQFTANQSGGRIVAFGDSDILFSIGDYRSRHLGQDKKSVNGKILKINIENSNYKIITMGNRNPQGLYFDKENNFILQTEHGPMGGDEINLIKVKEINEEKIQNYGWPITSAGEHYGGRSEKNKIIYKKYPLYKSHSEHGFIEPLKSFVPSIAISEIVKVAKNKYVVSSMKDKALYFFGLNKQKQIINLERIEVFERIRDLGFYNNKLYLFMETTASIGVLNLS